MNRTGRVSGYGMGRWQMRRVSIRLDASADRTVSGAGQSYSGSGRRCCAAVVVLVVRTDAGRERRRARGGAGIECGRSRQSCGRSKKSGEERISQTDPESRSLRRGADSCRATQRNWR